MARISGIDLPKNKRGEIGLTYIYGIGRSTAQDILEQAGVDFESDRRTTRVDYVKFAIDALIRLE